MHLVTETVKPTTDDMAYDNQRGDVRSWPSHMDEIELDINAVVGIGKHVVKLVAVGAHCLNIGVNSCG